jgi:hypothetical protein
MSASIHEQAKQIEQKSPANAALQIQNLMRQGMEMKKVGDKNWCDAGSPQGQQIYIAGVKCQNGGDADLVTP